MTKEQAVFWLLLLRFNPDNNVLPNEVIDIAIGAIVAQPERPTGHWERDGHHIKCSVCGIWMCDTDREGDAIPNSFCPNCGADMKGEQNAVN